MVAQWLWLSGLYVLVKWVNLSFTLKQEEIKSTANTMAERVAAYLMPIKQAGGRKGRITQILWVEDFSIFLKNSNKSFLKSLKTLKWDLFFKAVIMCYVNLYLQSSFEWWTMKQELQIIT